MRGIYLALSILFGGLVWLILVGLDLSLDKSAELRSRELLGITQTPIGKSALQVLQQRLKYLPLPVSLTRLISPAAWLQSGSGGSYSLLLRAWWLLILLELSLFFVWLLAGGEFPRVIGSCSLALALTILIPPQYISLRIKSRGDDFLRQLPFFLDMLTLCVEAGMGFLPALERAVASCRGILKGEMEQVLEDIRMGFTKQEALLDLQNRIPVSELGNLVQALLVTDRLGTSLARTLQTQSRLIRFYRTQKIERQARQAPIRIVPALVFFFLPGLLLIYLAPPILNFLLHNR